MGVGGLREKAGDAGVEASSPMKKEELVSAISDPYRSRQSVADGTEADSGRRHAGEPGDGGPEGGHVRIGDQASRSLQYSQEVTSLDEDPERGEQPGHDEPRSDPEVGRGTRATSSGWRARPARTPEPRVSSSPNGPSGISVVIATRDRRESLLRTLARLDSPGSPPITVLDNGSTDGTPAAVRTAHPRVTVRQLGENRGAVARNVGVAAVSSRYVAFSDDDSWWAPGSLERAADVLDVHPDVAVLVGRVRLAADGSDDAVSSKMARAPIGHRPGAPGPDVLGFPACAAVVRRDAFLAVGGFSPLLFFGGEETLLALDLAAAGWQQVYVDDVVAWHDPAGPATVAPGRWALQTRNDLLVDWLRRPLRTAAAGTARLTVRALRDPSAREALAGLVRRLPAALRGRRPVPREVADRFAAAHRPLPRLSSSAAG